MAEINVLSKDISELIAAGEVIERPASVIKELLENSIDAGAEHITVEIKNGGTTYMRITDDGCGIAPDQVATAFLRHATSKITSKDDLDSILTLGFRGEALASISAVARVEVLTKQHESELGTNYIIEGSIEKLNEPTGCPDGTTIIIRDIFYNVPVRQKFMKRDSAEANAIISIMQKIVLSHPEISFKLIKDNKVEFTSAGDGELYSAIYGVYGRDFAHDLIPVDYSENGIAVKGYVIKPLYSKSNRVFQNFFINGRFVKSVTCCVSLEEAYKNLIMVGKYPACAAQDAPELQLQADSVDVPCPLCRGAAHDNGAADGRHRHGDGLRLRPHDGPRVLCAQQDVTRRVPQAERTGEEVAWLTNVHPARHFSAPRTRSPFWPARMIILSTMSYPAISRRACARSRRRRSMSIITTKRSCLCAAAMVHSRSTVWITASSRTRLSTSGRFTATAISRTRGRRLRSPRAA